MFNLETGGYVLRLLVNSGSHPAANSERRRGTTSSATRGKCLPQAPAVGYQRPKAGWCAVYLGNIGLMLLQRKETVFTSGPRCEMLAPRALTKRRAVCRAIATGVTKD